MAETLSTATHSRSWEGTTCHIPQTGAPYPPESIPHLCAAHKEYFAWIDPIPDVDSSGVYRIGPLEVGLRESGDTVPRALRIDKNESGIRPGTTILSFGGRSDGTRFRMGTFSITMQA